MLKRRWRIWQIRVICGAPNRLCVSGKYLIVFGEYVGRIYAYMEMTQRGSWRIISVYISVNNNTNLNFLKILSNYTIWDRLSQKTSRATVPLKVHKHEIVLKFFYLHQIIIYPLSI